MAKSKFQGSVELWCSALLAWSNQLHWRGSYLERYNATEAYYHHLLMNVQIFPACAPDQPYHGLKHTVGYSK